MASSMLRIALVTNELPPYRVPMFSMLARTPGVVLQVILCSLREPNRNWEHPELDFDYVCLRERVIERNGRYIHNNPDVIPALSRFTPDVIVTGGFNPTHLYAFAYAMAWRIPHVPMADGTDISEISLGRIHILIRHLVFSRSRTFVAASDGGLRLFGNYKIPPELCYKAPLCVDNELFATKKEYTQKSYDFLFCGRFENVKNSVFAVQVAVGTARKLGRKTSIAFLGTGPQEADLKHYAATHTDVIDVSFHGFVPHANLPPYYWAARIFLFPTLFDVWGVVANEACAAGVPVIISPFAGAAGELIQDGENGYVCGLDVDHWVARASALLTQREMWMRMSRNSVTRVRDYSYDRAVLSIVHACKAAVSSFSVGNPLGG